MSSSDPSFPRIMRLKGSADYPSWKTSIKYTLISVGLWDLVIGTETRPSMTTQGLTDTATQVTNPLYVDWVNKNNRASAIIMLNVSPEVTVVIDNMQTAKEMWDHLNSVYTPHGFNLQYVLFTNLYTLRLEQFASVNDYALKYKGLLIEIAASGLVLDETLKIILFLTNLGSSYNQWVTAKRSAARTVLPSLDSLIAELVDEERLEGGHENLALMGKTKGKDKDKKEKEKDKKDKGSKDKKKNVGRGKGKDGKCTHCERGVHAEENCWHKYPDKMPEGVKKKQDAKKASNSDGNRRHNEDTLSLTAIEPSQEVAFIANETSWIPDSGATSHICCDLSSFSSIDMIEDGHPIRGVSGSADAQGIGTVVLRLEHEGGNGFQDVTLTRVYYMPGIGMNLFSIGTAETKGVNIEIKEGVLRLKDRMGKTLGYAPRSGKLYYLQASTIKSEQALSAMHDNKISKATWHRRFGHLGDTVLDQMVDNPNIHGVDLRGLKKQPPQQCKVCLGAGQKRQPSRQPQQRATKVADLVHIDVVGPITPTAFDGSTWYIVFTDDHTRWRYVCNMKTKGQAKVEIERFVNMVSTQMDRTVKRVRIDNGREFGGKALIDWLKDNGISYEATVPYAPEQNGIAERSNGLLAEKARAMILDSGASYTLWPEAVKTACYILNRLPSSTLKDNKVPLQVLYESLNEDGTADPIDVSHIRSFGCTAYVHIPKEKRRQGAKFEIRSNRGILVGFEGRNQYRIWLPEEGKDGRVVRARDVKFDEGPGIYDWNTDPKLPNALEHPQEQADNPGVRNPDVQDGVTSTEQGGVNNSTPHPSPTSSPSSMMTPKRRLSMTVKESNSPLDTSKDEEEAKEEDVTQEASEIDLPEPIPIHPNPLVILLITDNM